jgi:hypothetical protein
MFILAQGGHSFARLRYNVGPGVDVKLPVEINYGRPFLGSDEALWQDEYLANVRVPAPEPPELLGSNTRNSPSSRADEFHDDSWRDVWREYVDFDRIPQEIEYGYGRDF